MSDFKAKMRVKFDFGWDSAPDTAGGDYSWWGGGLLPHLQESHTCS